MERRKLSKTKKASKPRRMMADPDTEKIEPLLPSDVEAAFLKTYEILVRLGLRSR